MDNFETEKEKKIEESWFLKNFFLQTFNVKPFMSFISICTNWINLQGKIIYDRLSWIDKFELSNNGSFPPREAHTSNLTNIKWCFSPKGNLQVSY